MHEHKHPHHHPTYTAHTYPWLWDAGAVRARLVALTRCRCMACSMARTDEPCSALGIRASGSALRHTGTATVSTNTVDACMRAWQGRAGVVVAGVVRTEWFREWRTSTDLARLPAHGHEARFLRLPVSRMTCGCLYVLDLEQLAAP